MDTTDVDDIQKANGFTDVRTTSQEHSEDRLQKYWLTMSKERPMGIAFTISHAH